MKKKLSIVLAITLTLILSLSAVAFASSGEVVGKEVNEAQSAGQAWLDRIATLPGMPSEWIEARLTAPQVYCDLQDEPNAYMFAIEKDSKVVGQILVGSSAYGYPVFQAGDAAPPSIPTAGEVKSSLEKDLGFTVAEESIGEPISLLHLGVDELWAVYDIEGQMVGVNLIFGYATPASNLKSYMLSPQEYKDAKQKIREAMPDKFGTLADYQKVLTMYGWNNCGPCGDYDLCWCGPCSLVSIGQYYRDVQGYGDLPSNCGLYNDFIDLGCGGPLEGAGYGPAFVDMTEMHDYNNFSYAYDNSLSEEDYFYKVVPSIDDNWPLGLLLYGLGENHWRAIRGYFYTEDPDWHTHIFCTNSNPLKHNEVLEWAYVYDEHDGEIVSIRD